MTSSNTIANLLEKRGWFSVHKAFVLEFGLEASVVLHFLINHQEITQGCLSQKQFFCTTKTMEHHVGIPSRTQTRILKILAKANTPVIEVEIKGFPPRRFIRFRFNDMAKILSDWSKKNPGKTELNNGARTCTNEDSTMVHEPAPRFCTNLHQRDIYIKENITNNKIKGGGRKSATRSPLRVSGFFVDDWDRAFGVRLRSILVDYDSDLVSATGRRGVRADTLAKNSSRLRNERNVSKKRIKAVIEWMKDHYADTYSPQMHKAEDFFAKWTKFEQAMLRSSNGQTKKGFTSFMGD